MRLFIRSIGCHGCVFRDGQLGVRLDGKTPLFVLVIEYEYDMVIGYAYDMGFIVIGFTYDMGLIHLV